MSLKVLISGAGIGGLALAQSLRRSGIAFEVFERDTAIDSRAQGYRIRMDAAGDAALRTCLPPNLFDLYNATSSMPTAPPIGALNQNLELIYRFPVPDPASAWHVRPNAHVTVNRHTLRQILLAGIEPHVRFGHAAIAAEQNDDFVRLEFSNAPSVTGDLLVAAEGINSPLRRLILPHAEILDLGMTCIYGRAPLTPDLATSLPESLGSGFTPILGPDRRTMGVGPFRKRAPFAESAARFRSNFSLDFIDDYMMWILVAPHAEIAHASQSPAALHETARALTRTWHPALQNILARADVSATFPIPIRSSKRIAAWQPTRITFLGDAIHAMTPAGGIGANTALRDAALLSYLLEHVGTGTIPLAHAVESYEADMREYAFAAVERSLTGAAYLYQLAAPQQKGA
ncbi:MAG: NAD(P)/FAD-dependent oxidoreductase [Candidatus Acidiferrales bacterium]